MRLTDCSWTDLAARRSPPLLAVPLGSCEQHGPHLPLDTDTRLALGYADGLAARRTDVLVAPALTIGTSWEHHGFPGLLSMDRHGFADLLVELARSSDWAAGLVFVNGHGGNHAALQDAVAMIVGDGRRALAWSPRVPGGDAHAGHVETSLLLAMDPTSVRIDELKPGWTGGLDEVMTRGVLAVSPTGVLGDPTEATAEAGRWILDRLIDDLVAAVDRWWA